MKIVKNILSVKTLGILTLFLISFIPLYPKLPLVDIRNTWVYIRVEDFVVLFTLFFWIALIFLKKVSLKTPLTIPILIYWLVGAIATIHGIVIIFPQIANVFPNVALLSYIRHIEYLSLFFIAFSAVENKKYVFIAIGTTLITLLGVIFYGFGQRLFSFPAYLTMNEEYAKGIPIIISDQNRIPSTFAGHYDLAAYLVLLIPIVVSLAFFGFRNIFMKFLLLFLSFLGVILLFMTVSRVSFFVMFVALFFVILFQKKKLLLGAIPLAILAAGVFLYSQSSLLSRFGNTVEKIDVLVDAESGGALGHAQFRSRDYLFDKNISNLKNDNGASKEATLEQIKYATLNNIPLHLARYELPVEIPVIQAETVSTGETLPQGSSYINLSLSPVKQRLGLFVYELPAKDSNTPSTVQIRQGTYLIKTASAYDISFTTRFQGEWPNALEAFYRNLLFGSGYGSVSLAVDNNYYRMLGETGLLGTGAFVIILLILGVYIKKQLPHIESNVFKSFVLGFAAGMIGLSLNAILIDVFEASKVAFVLWITTGIVVGGLSLYQKKEFLIKNEIVKILTSSYAILCYLFLLTVAMYSTAVSGYFIGDDFTWFRWASECGSDCSIPGQILNYFLNSEGFFYRPGSKIYFLFMYKAFWLNQVAYHAVSIIAHFGVVLLLYLLARKILRNNFLAAICSFIFLVISGYMEVVLWISGIGHIFNAMLMLVGLYMFVLWYEKKKIIFYIISLVSSLLAATFHELGVVTPLLALSYILFQTSFSKKQILILLRTKIYYLLFIPTITYLLVRLFSDSHWFNGDYSYNILKLPLNIIGNIIGYILITVFGPLSYPVYEQLRYLTRSNILMAFLVGACILGASYVMLRFINNVFSMNEKKIIVFSLFFFIICLLPFLGLGNVAFRYSYLASFGIILICVLLGHRMYEYFKMYGKTIAILIIVLFISVFSLIHIVQAQQAVIEWNGAGEKVERFLISVDALYEDAWSNNDVVFYFANVPIKNNNAWVFPVGIEDSLWFAFQNPQMTVNRVSAIDSIDQSVYKTPNNWVFEFQSDGSIKNILLSDVMKKND